MRSLLIPLLLAAAALPGLSQNALELIRMSAKPNDKFRSALINAMGDEAIVLGTAAVGMGPDYIFAVEATKQPQLCIDGKSRGKMKRVKGWNLWFRVAQLLPGISHSFYYEIGGRRKGGQTDLPVYLSDCYPHTGVPQGTLSAKLVHRSRIYKGMECNYWIYVPAQYDGRTPAALMVWQDGQNHIRRNGKAKTLNVIDNLIHRGKIPVMITVFVAPGHIGEEQIRSREYDRIDDTYARFLRDELLPEVARKYKIRTDAYSRAIAGVSSGAVCAFNVAWRQPDQFSRVLSLIGSYASIAGIEQGGHLFPFKVRKGEVRNIRVWLQEGEGDLENEHGSWPLMNLQLANSLKFKGYDFHFSWGSGTHNAAHGYSELPVSLTWLWRGYDPAKTQEVFVPDQEERKLPYFRVRQLNR